MNSVKKISRIWKQVIILVLVNENISSYGKYSFNIYLIIQFGLWVKKLKQKYTDYEFFYVRDQFTSDARQATKILAALVGITMQADPAGIRRYNRLRNRKISLVFSKRKICLLIK